MFLDEHLVILSYQSSLQHKSNVFLQFLAGGLQLTVSIHFVDGNTIQQDSLQKGRICEKKYNLYIFCAERHHAENFGNLLEMFIAAIILAFQKNDLWTAGIYTHCLESVEESIGWFISLRKLDA